MQNTGYRYLSLSLAPRGLSREPPREESTPTPSAKMLQLIGGLWVSRALYVVAQLGIADLLRNGPQRSEELARTTGTRAPLLYRVLRALASVGVFAEDEAGRFSLTPLATTLRSDMPDSLRSFVLAELGEESLCVWEDVL